MTQFSLAELFGITIRESANDGSDFTNPSADYRRLFLGEDGYLHVKDSAGTVTSPYSTSGGTSAFHGVLAYHNTTESLTGPTVFALNSEDYDTDGYHSTSSNTSRLTVPSSLGGYYFIHGHQYTGAGTERAVSIRKTLSGGGNSLLRGSYAASQFGGLVTAIVNLAVGDYVELFTTETATFGHASNPERMSALGMHLIGT